MISDILKIISNTESSGDLSKYFVTLIITIYILSNNNILQGIDILPSPNSIPIPPNIPETIQRPSCSLLPIFIISIISGYLMYNLINFVLDIFINSDRYNISGDYNISDRYNRYNRYNRNNRCNKKNSLNRCPFGFDINMDICKLFPCEYKYKTHYSQSSSSNSSNSSKSSNSSNSSNSSKSSNKKFKINEDIEKINKEFIKTLKEELNNHISQKNQKSDKLNNPKKDSIYDDKHLDDFVNIENN